MKLQIGMIGIILLIGVIVKKNTCIKWIGLRALTRSDELEMEGFTQSECDRALKNRLLQRRHYKFCLHRKHRFAMHAVLMASQAASYYCMKTFRDRRWNCKSIEKLPKLSPELELGTQEQAIVHAFSSAALLFEISRRCSQSKLQHCPCGVDNLQNRVSSDSRSSTYYYANCPDNVAMGVEYTKRFLGYDRMGKKAKSDLKNLNTSKNNDKDRKLLRKIINGHNYAVGIDIMNRSWKSKCKCHGVSGSCANEICFRQLRRLDDDVLLNDLKHHYLAAKYVASRKNDNLYNEQNMELGKNDLAFIEHSSDYCAPDPKAGSVGTQGRQCETANQTQTATNHCSNMCCGRGYRKVIEQETESCKCSLDQNFVVKCKVCTKITENKFCL